MTAVRPRRRLGRAALRLVAGALLAVVAYVGITFGQVWWTATRDRATTAPAIVVLGAAQYQGSPSPVFAARLDHAADLYSRGLAPIVVVTGGRPPGDVFSEANAADAYLQARGVPSSALRLEVDGRTTYESLAASALILDNEGIEQAILVSDGWHLGRSAAIARAVGLEPLPSPAPGSPYSRGRTLQQMLRETAGLSIGRIIGFRRLDNLSITTVAQTATSVVRR